MATIRTAIELEDRFTGVMYNIVQSTESSVDALGQMQSAMAAPVSTASIEGAGEQMEQAALSARALGAAMEGLEGPAVSAPGSGMSIPVEPVITRQPQIDLPQELVVPVTAEVVQQPQIELPEAAVVDVSVDGAAEMEQQLSELASRLDSLTQMQGAIQNIAGSLYVLPKETARDISETGNQLQRVQKAMEFLRENPFHMNAASVQLQLDSMRTALEQVGEAQRDVDQYLDNMASRSLEIAVKPKVEPPEPVEIQWQSDPAEVFTIGGEGQFWQEVRSAKEMLSTLSQTQERIAQTAARTDIFSPAALGDISRMEGRIAAIQQQIQGMEQNSLDIGTREANAQLEQLRGQLAQAVQEQRLLNAAVEHMDVREANGAYLQLSRTVGGMERNLRDNTREQQRFNQEVQRGAAETSRLTDSIKGMAAAYISIQSVQKAIGLSDRMTQTTARLELITEDGGSVEELQNRIYASAQAARGSYLETADVVSKLGLMAGEAFSGPGEIVAFMEQVNKQFTIAGTDAQGISAAMLQLTQAMGSGVLRGEEFNSVLEQAPNIIQSIADYLDVPKGQLKDMASEGKLTADIVKAAVFAAAEETNAKFESMPQTFSQIWTSFRNDAVMAFQPVLSRMNELAGSEGFQEMVSRVSGALFAAAGLALNALNLMAGAAEFVVENWGWISPIVYTVVGALTIYYGWMLLTKAASVAAAAGQLILNAAMLACPIVLIVLGFYGLIAIINHFAGTSVSATGLITGAFAVLGTYILNRFVVPVQNGLASFINFIGNAFNDPVSAAKVLFYDMALTVVGYIQNMASAIETLLNRIPGVTIDITGGLDSFYTGLEQAQKAIKDESGWVEYVQKMEYVDYADAWDKGYSFGEGIEDRISSLDPASLLGGSVDMEDYLGGNFGSLDAIADDTGAIRDSLDVTEEELKYLRDIAAQETINRFTTAEITIQQTNHNSVSGRMDLDGVVDGLTEAMREAIPMVAEGVHT